MIFNLVAVVVWVVKVVKLTFQTNSKLIFTNPKFGKIVFTLLNILGVITKGAKIFTKFTKI